MPHTPVVLLIAWATALAYFDLRYRRIPNLLSLGAWCVAGAVLWLQHSSLLGHQASSALMAACFGAVVTLPAYALGLLGAGDVKMLVAMGLMTSLPITIGSFIVAALLGAMIAAMWIAIDRWGTLLWRQHAPATDPFNAWLLIPLRKRKMAYGALFSTGLAVNLWLEFRA